MSLSTDEQKRCDEWFHSWFRSDAFQEGDTWKMFVEKVWGAAIDAKDKEIEALKGMTER